MLATLPRYAGRCDGSAAVHAPKNLASERGSRSVSSSALRYQRRRGKASHMPARKAAALTQSVLVRFSRGNRSQRAPAAAKGVPTAMRSLGDAKQSCNSGRHLICLRFGPGKDGWRVVAYQLDHRPVPSGVCFCVAAVHAQGRRGVLARVDHQVDVALPELRKPCGVDAIQLVAVAKDTDNHRAETSLLRPLAVGGRATRASETDARAHKGVRIERHAVYLRPTAERAVVAATGNE